MLKHELKNFLFKTGKTKQENLIKTIAGYIRAGKAPGEEFKSKKRSKQQEEKLITGYLSSRFHSHVIINERNLLLKVRNKKFI